MLSTDQPCVYASLTMRNAGWTLFFRVTIVTEKINMTYTHKQQVTDLVLASKKNFLLLFCEVLFQALLLFVPEKSAQLTSSSFQFYSITNTCLVLCNSHRCSGRVNKGQESSVWWVEQGISVSCYLIDSWPYSHGSQSWWETMGGADVAQLPWHQHEEWTVGFSGFALW